MQTLIFKEDESGMATAEALVRAAKRGVDVRVVIDALGNLETLDHLIDGRPLYQYLRENGVKLELYNHPSAQGLGSLVNALDRIDALSAVKSPDDLKDPTLLFLFAARRSPGCLWTRDNEQRREGRSYRLV